MRPTAAAADSVGVSPRQASLDLLSDSRILQVAHLAPDAAAWLRRWVAAHAGG